jgi:hypothetical protein
LRNVLILGSGRSGTSMLAGTLARAGWFVGESPYAPRASNPKGFFESAEINGINEYLLAEALPPSEGTRDWQRWLARLPDDLECRASARVDERIRASVRRAPWCFKDPRLCYTLPVWRPHVGAAALVCVFRDPAVTARSIVKECRDEEYLHGLGMDAARALEVWNCMYRRVLDRHRREGDWLFLHYEQALTPAGLERVERFVGAPISRDFPDQALRRTRADDALPGDVAATYAELCELAGFANPRRTVVAASPPPPRSLAPPPEVERADLAARNLVRRRARARLWLERGAPGEPPPEPWMEHATRQECEDYVVQRLPRIPLWERLLRELGEVDPEALAAAGAAAARREVVAAVARAAAELAQVAAREEVLRALDREGVNGVAELARRAPWPLATDAPTRVLAWPDWTRADLEALWRAHGLALASGSRALCLRFDARVDGDRDQALARLQDSYASALPSRPAIEAIVVDEPLSDEDWRRLGLAIDEVLVLPSGGARTAAVLSLGRPLAGAGS